MAYKVLFLCTANSARSILFASTLSHLGGTRFDAHSAGSQPAGVVNPHALAELHRRGIATEGVRSKSWDEYTADGAPTFDLVVTVCDSAANESCPVFFGGFVKAHWGLPDPAGTAGDAAAVAAAFRITEDVVSARLARLLTLPLESMDREALQHELSVIAVELPARQLLEQAA
ncbi:arsenate reductase ArsC [Lysobacter sp. TAF61]|uniref:arsenate reductase ArsC n=1 Tax=Lysobacter sp. TAF61 TaxID=3233072 RepID=UPI003F96FB08